MSSPVIRKFKLKISSETTLRQPGQAVTAGLQRAFSPQAILRRRLALALLSISLATPGYAQFGSEWPNTDPEKTNIDITEIMSGGPPKDGIPSIDEPEFVDQASAEKWLDPREPVISLAIDEEARAYPLQILMWHEIVNDEVAGVPVSVTFCPLCNASIAFDRRLDGEIYDFGTTGRLGRQKAGGNSSPAKSSSVNCWARPLTEFPRRLSRSRRFGSPGPTASCYPETPVTAAITGRIPTAVTTRLTISRFFFPIRWIHVCP